MPSFDIVSKTEIAEVDNAINGAMREISSRYDFKNSQSSIKRETDEIHLIAEDNYKIDQLQQIFRTHLVKRKLSSGSFNFSKVKYERKSKNMLEKWKTYMLKWDSQYANNCD